MKSIKLLSAVAVVAMFAACAEEDLFHVDNTPQQMNEVVGTKLVGTDISLNADKEGKSATRMTINGSWEATDLLGLGWLVSTSPAVDQSPNVMPTKSDFFANHMFSYDENAGAFTSKGNIYEGWYLAYYPWKYDKKTGVKFFEVNPAQTSQEIAARMSQGLHVSNLQYVSADSLNADNSLNTSFQMYGAVSYLQVRTTPAGEFVKGGKLAGKTIQSVTINVGDGNDIFADSLRFAAKNIKPYDATQTDSANIAGVMDFAKVLIPVDGNNAEGRDSEITTNVAAAKFDVSDEKTRLITIVVPATAELDSTKLSLEVAIPAGKFVIKYVKDAVAGSYADTNNKALGALAAAYKDGGKLTATGNVQTLNVVLYGDIFETDFAHISNVTEWNEAVDMVDALGRTKEIFKIDDTIVFTDSIKMPKTCALTVERASGDSNKKVESFRLAGTEFNGWPANLTSNVYLTVSSTVTWNNANEYKNNEYILNEGTIVVPDGAKNNVLTIGSNQFTLENKGTIKLGKYAKAERVDNSMGRIEVIYGSYVAIKDKKDELKGEIAYVVMPADTLKPVRIQNVINTEGNLSGEYALANVLIFDAANGIKSFDFTKPISGTDDIEDPYNTIPGSDPSTLDFEGLDGVNIEINNVTVTSSTKLVTVKSAELTGANASLTNVNVMNGLTVTGKGAVIATSINGNVTTDGNVTAEAIIGDSITANGSVLNAETIKGTLTLTSCTVEATTITGNVNLTNCTVKATTIDGDVVINGTNNTLNVAEITGSVTINNGAAITGANIGGDVTVVAGTVNLTNINVAGDLENKGTTTIDGAEAAIGTIDNYNKLYANTNITVSTITNRNGCETYVSYTDVDNFSTIWYTVESGEINEKNSLRKGEVVYKGAATVLAEFKAAVADGGNVTLVADVVLDAPLVVSKNVTIDLNGKTLQNKVSNDGDCGQTGAIATAVFYLNDANAHLTIAGEGEIVADNESAEYNMPVWVREGTVTIEGGHFKSGQDKSGNACHAVYAQNSAKVYIKGGTFEVEGNASGMTYASVLNCKDGSNAQIILSGGSFKNFGATEAASVGTNEVICATGYKWTDAADANGYYSVVAE